MGPRYLLLVGDEGPERAELVEQMAVRTGVLPALATRQMAVLVNDACGLIPLGHGGCILGWLFHRHGPARRLTRLADEDVASILRSAGDTLVTAFWGGYVAIIAEVGATTVMRDPSGTFPCYYASEGRFTLLASDADLLVAAGVAIDPDLDEIGRQLFRAFVPSPATALRRIRELLAGFTLRVPVAAKEQEPCWSPWNHVANEDEPDDEAPERLSRVVHHCVHAWGRGQGRLLLSVSGGLDSSIVAACLARAGVDIMCLTMFSDDPAGDERLFARALCDHLKLPLIEKPYRLEDIDLYEPLGAHLPRPRDRTQANAFERVHCEVASEIGAAAFVTGNGGDHVFGFSQSAAPIADRYLVEGLGLGVLHSLSDVCRQTGCNIFAALAQAWSLSRRTNLCRVEPNSLFLSPAFVTSLSPLDLHHPWLDAPAGALPGKAAHISTILRVQPNLEASRGAFLPVLNPLMSQPIVEECLAIPSWEWRADGLDRSAVRRAFEGELPAAVRKRRVKGTPSGFAARLVDHFRAQIRECVLEGRLAANGITDKRMMETALTGEGPIPDLERVRILEIVNAEAWLAHWVRRQQAPGVRSDVHARLGL
jgi:asparagine synthase (glutamine-hydrolysing)